ncbi:MAG: hypothetical protein KGZ64_07975 [Thermaerobacter sp.]|nr:hypothetical protein [Thermaerobacter sp.]
MLKKFLSVSLVLSLTMALIMVSPTAPETYSAQASCIGCTENVITTVQLQALLAAEDNTAVGHVVASTAFQGISNRLSGNTKFRVSSVGEGTYVVAFEVLPLNHADPGVFFLYHELALFVVQNDAVVSANVNSRVMGDSHLIYQSDLFSQRTVAIRTAEPMRNLSLPPQEIRPVPPVDDTYSVSPGCWVCMERVHVSGRHDDGCLFWGAAACAVAALTGVAAALCYAAVWAACWIPGYSYCVSWVFFSDCLSEFSRNLDAI